MVCVYLYDAEQRAKSLVSLAVFVCGLESLDLDSAEAGGASSAEPDGGPCDAMEWPFGLQSARATEAKLNWAFVCGYRLPRIATSFNEGHSLSKMHTTHIRWLVASTK